MKIHCTYAEKARTIMYQLCKRAKHFHQARIVHAEYYVISNLSTLC